MPQLRATIGGWYRAIQREWREGRLSLAGLTAVERSMALLALGAIATACGVVLATTLGIRFPGGTVAIQGSVVASRTPVEFSPVALIVVAIGLAVAAATIALAATRPHPAGRWWVLALMLTLLALAGLIFESDGAVQLVLDVIDRGNTLAVSVYQATGVLALVVALALPIMVFVRVPGSRVLAPVVAALPFLALVCAIAVAAGEARTIMPWVQAQFPDYPPSLHALGAILATVQNVILWTSGLLVLLVVWQASTWSRASARFAGLRVGRVARRSSWLLGALLAAKISWIVLGIGGFLPPLLGGGANAWPAILSDDASSWLIAAVLAAAAAIWLLRKPRGMDERAGLRAAGYVAVAFASTSLLLAALPLVLSALTAIAPSSAEFPSPPVDISASRCLDEWAPLGPAPLLTCLAYPMIGFQAWLWTFLIAAALVIGLVLLRRTPSNAGAMFLVIAGAWGVPRALSIVLLPSIDPPQPATMDAAITFMVAVLAVAWWVGAQRQVGQAALALVLVASTLVVHVGSVAPTVGFSLLLAVGVVFPVVYELAFGSAELNQEKRDQAGRLLASVGVRAMALTLLAALVVVDVGELRGSRSQDDLAFMFLGLPVAATIVAAMISRFPRPTPAPVGRVSPGAALAGHLGGAVAAVVAVIVLISLAWAAQPLVSALYPSRSERLQAIEVRVAATKAEFDTLAGQDPAAFPAAATALWRRETSWLTDNPAPECASDAWTAWRDVVDDYRELALILDGLLHPPSPVPQAEIDAIQGRASSWQRMNETHLAGLDAALGKASAVCLLRPGWWSR